MARQTVIQESFSAGVVSALTYGRYSAEGYAQGCKELENMIPDSRGPALSRDGTAFVQSFTGNNGRIFSLQVDRTEFYSIILLDNLLTISSLLGHIPATNYVLNSHFHDGSTNWTSLVSTATETVTFSDHLATLHVAANPARYAGIAQQITVPASGDYKLLVTSDGGAIYDVRIGTAADDGTYLDTTGINANEVFDFTVPGTTFWVTIMNDSDDSFDDVGVRFVGATEVAAGSPEFVTPWTEDELDEIHIIQVADGFVSYFVHPHHPPQKLVYDPGTDSFSYSVVTFTLPPSEWATGNYPATGAYFDGRLWLAAAPDHRQHIWSSKSGLPENFDSGTGLDDEAITIVIAAFGGIEWLRGTKNLMVGTDSAEHIIDSAAGIITPSDHQVTQQSAYGSSNVQAEQVGDQVFYISPDGFKLRAMQYEWSKDNWLSTDLTYFSNTAIHSPMKSVAWLQNPGNLFVCVMQDGHFAVLSYDRSNNIYGWSHHDIGDECVDISVGSVQGSSVLGLLVKRVTGELYYESQALERHRLLDSWVERFYGTPTDTIAGLEHLEGREVQVVADESMHPVRTVSSGQIILDREVSKALVGLQYIAKMTLLPVEKGAEAGASAPYMKSYHRLDVHLMDSANPLINGKRAASRSPSTPMDTAEPVISGKSYIKLGGWNNETDVTITQDLPYPLNIIAVSGEIDLEKL